MGNTADGRLLATRRAVRLGGRLAASTALLLCACATPPTTPPARAAAGALDPALQREAEENTFGSPAPQPIEEFVARFNAELARRASWPGGRVQPPVTPDEVVAAIRHRLLSGSPLPDELRRDLRRIAETGVVPKGARLFPGAGFRDATEPGDDAGANPVDVDLWSIELKVWLDRFPDQGGAGSPAPPVLVRLQHLAARRSAPRAPGTIPAR